MARVTCRRPERVPWPMIVLKNREEIEKIRTASRYAAEILLSMKEHVKEGIRTA